MIDETNSVSADALQEVQKLLQFGAEKEGVQDQAEVSDTIVTNEEIREINRGYRGKDTPTDLISFALEEEGADWVETEG
ncbi:rRNA maturation RNase YbeY, partial [Bacillus sp. GbtcB15]|uniref:rRNA maturation RNase YbeY n=1 Tax=Bacillus sp. GbtcB15 TaxID=2824760 RepID=UPI0034D21199